jgi:GNAT superfamily N-acetyltransferase
MALTVERGGRELAATAVAALAAWTPRHAPATTLHAGDVGWHLRHDDADLDETLVVVRDGSEITAVALSESGALRPTVRPDHADDDLLAAAVGEVALSLAERAADSSAPSEFSCDTPPHSALRAWLVAHGWSVDPDPWALVFRPLSAADADVGAGLAAPVATDDDVRERVVVQVNAFERSTFTVHRWHQMAAGPAYRRDLDLLRRDDGVAVAGATAWTAGPGRVGILEPVGTHREHIGRGHGRAVTLAAIGALARAGASGVAVQTPLSNAAAVRTYESCGLRTIDHLHSLRYRSPHS